MHFFTFAHSYEAAGMIYFVREVFVGADIRFELDMLKR